jgi:hypothetical protein
MTPLLRWKFEGVCLVGNVSSPPITISGTLATPSVRGEDRRAPASPPQGDNQRDQHQAGDFERSFSTSSLISAPRQLLCLIVYAQPTDGFRTKET